METTSEDEGGQKVVEFERGNQLCSWPMGAVRASGLREPDLQCDRCPHVFKQQSLWKLPSVDDHRTGMTPLDRQRCEGPSVYLRDQTWWALK